MKHSGGFAPLLIIVIVAIVALIGVVIANPFGERGEAPGIIKKLIEDSDFGGGFSNLPDCNGQQYTTPLVELDEIESISPLGNLNPPEHTTPTQHMYINLYSTEVTLRAPGDITLSSISSSSDSVRNSTDYSINFSLCGNRLGYFLHIKTLSPQLQGLLSDKNCNSYGDNNKYTNCWAGINKELKAGEVIGTVGNNQQGNFDFGAYTDQSDQAGSIVCPLDFYANDLAQSLYSKVEREKDPICGVVYQNVDGTLAGDWYAGDRDDWNNALTFGHENNNPNIATVSIGGVFTSPGTFSFLPKSEGLINHEFTQTQTGVVYCFQSADNVDTESRRTDGSILVQMSTETTLQIEHQQASCGSSFSFTNPTIYNR